LNEQEHEQEYETKPPVSYQGIQLIWDSGEWSNSEGTMFALNKQDGDIYEGDDVLNDAILIDIETNEVVVNDIADWTRKIKADDMREFTREEHDDIAKHLRSSGLQVEIYRGFVYCQIKDVGNVVDSIGQFYLSNTGFREILSELKEFPID